MNPRYSKWFFLYLGELKKEEDATKEWSTQSARLDEIGAWQMDALLHPVESTMASGYAALQTGSILPNTIRGRTVIERLLNVLPSELHPL